ncbi:MAG: UDP-N-acetylglucosamine 1-carboxyvinyltransferase [Lachnospiraceae bacterium]|nr:UDP-N-acetylglucosamine 1-carboxyvinyltransferase [Lachnospiraceae bacterium]
MAVIEIIGGRPLTGELMVQGSKNAALPLMAACVLCRGTVRLANCPDIQDVQTMTELLRTLGCRVIREQETLCLDTSGPLRCEVTGEEVRKSRASILLLGALAGREHRVRIARPGGCSIGERKIDLHLAALESLGMQVEEKGDVVICEGGQPEGCEIVLRFPSVGATENAILASVLAKGTTRIQNAAAEPEIGILCEFLNQAGAKITGAGTGTITIQGVEALSDTEYTLSGDRIVAGTYLAAAAGTHGEVRLRGVRIEELGSLLPLLEEMGCGVWADEEAGCVELWSKGKLKSAEVITKPYPGFPTDMQSQMLALFCRAEGISRVSETIFENRFHAAGELGKLGAKIQVEENTAIVTGAPLSGGTVTAADLRGGAALVLAGLFAKGTTTVCDPQNYIGRGYEDIVRDLQRLGAEMKRLA